MLSLRDIAALHLTSTDQNVTDTTASVELAEYVNALSKDPWRVAVRNMNGPLFQYLQTHRSPPSPRIIAVTPLSWMKHVAKYWPHDDVIKWAMEYHRHDILELDVTTYRPGTYTAYSQPLLIKDSHMVLATLAHMYRQYVRAVKGGQHQSICESDLSTLLRLTAHTYFTAMAKVVIISGSIPLLEEVLVRVFHENGRTRLFHPQHGGTLDECLLKSAVLSGSVGMVEYVLARTKWRNGSSVDAAAITAGKMLFLNALPLLITYASDTTIQDKIKLWLDKAETSTNVSHQQRIQRRVYTQALIGAVIKGHTDAIKGLIEVGADIQPALLVALKKRRRDSIQLLMDLESTRLNGIVDDIYNHGGRGYANRMWTSYAVAAMYWPHDQVLSWAVQSVLSAGTPAPDNVLMLTKAAAMCGRLDILAKLDTTIKAKPKTSSLHAAMTKCALTFVIAGPQSRALTQYVLDHPHVQPYGYQLSDHLESAFHDEPLRAQRLLNILIKYKWAISWDDLWDAAMFNSTPANIKLLWRYGQHHPAGLTASVYKFCSEYCLLFQEDEVSSDEDDSDDDNDGDGYRYEDCCTLTTAETDFMLKLEPTILQLLDTSLLRESIVTPEGVDDDVTDSMTEATRVRMERQLQCIRRAANESDESIRNQWAENGHHADAIDNVLTLMWMYRYGDDVE